MNEITSLQNKLSKLKRKISNDKYDILKKGLLQLNKGINGDKVSYNLAIFCCCVVIESLNTVKFIQFDVFLKNKIKENIIIDENNIFKLYSEYHQNYGARKNFVNTILKTYDNNLNYPMIYKPIIMCINNLLMKNYTNWSKEELTRQDLEKLSKKVYDDYRSKFVHSGKLFSEFEYKKSKFLYLSNTKNFITPISFFEITLNVVEYNV